MRGDMDGIGRRMSAGAALLTAAMALAGCGSTSDIFKSSPLDLFNSSSKATAGPASANAAADADIDTDVDCPGVQIRTGAATLMIGSKPGEGEPSALDLRYQGSIVRTARECHVSGGIMTMKVGIEGRVVTGPAGGPGEVVVPLRLAVVQEGPNPKAIVSKFAQIPVTITARGRPRHLHPYRSRYQLPAAAAGRTDRRLCRLCRLRFGRRAAAGRRKSPRPSPGRLPRNRRRNRRQSPRAKARLPPAQIDDGAFERAHVGDHGAGAGGREVLAEPRPGMAAADKADHGHAGGDAGGDADRRILHHDAVGRRHAHLGRGVQEQVGRRLAVRTSLPENRYGSKKRIRSVVSRLTRMRSRLDDEATHFGPRSQESA